MGITRTTIAGAILVCLCAATPFSALAQSASSDELESVLEPGDTVWITDVAGDERKTRIVGVSAGVVTASADGAIRRLRSADIMRVRARKSDSLLNGALIGAGAAVATGLFFCQLMEPWENCRDDVGPMLQLGGIGAGIGMGIDALIRGRKTIYESREGVTLGAAPIASRRARGMRVALSF